MKRIIAVLLFLKCFLVFAQHNNELNFTKIPPSPVSAKFNQYLAAEPNLTNGSVNIPVNIFNISVKDYTLPVNLVYGTSGISIMDSPLPLGYGWALNINPRVNRTVLGRPDEKYTFKSSFDPGASNWASRITGADYGGFGEYYEPLKGIVKNDATLSTYQLTPEDLFDGQKDIFSIQLPNKSINFIIEKNGSSLSAYSYGNYVKIFLNYVDVHIRGFKIIDEDGIVYFFGNFNNENEAEYLEEYGENCTSWLLRKIQLATSEEINFKWINNNISFYKPQTSVAVQVSDYKNTSHPSSPGDPTPFPEVSDYGGIINVAEYSNPYSKMLKEITFPNGSIDFVYKSVNDPFLTQIDVRNSLDQLIRNVKFNYGDKNTQLEHVLLKSVNVNGELYSFSYNQNRFTQGSTALDYWGFYNGKEQDSQVPKVFLKYYSNYSYINSPPGNTGLFVGSADKTVDTAKMKAFILERINYPTGGYTRFEYEPHEFSYTENYPGFEFAPPSISFGGGLRVKGIINYDASGEILLEKKYKYGLGENGKANIKLIPTLNTFIDEVYHWNYYYPAYTLTNRTLSIKALSDYNSYDFGKSSFWYEEVNEYINDRKRSFKYIFVDDVLSSINSFKLFSNKYTSSVYTIFQNGPQLAEQINYKIEDNLYLPVTKTELEYEWMFDHSKNFDNLLINRRMTVSGIPAGGNGIDPIYPYNGTLLPLLQFDDSDFRFNVGNYKIIPAFNRLKKVTESEYSTSGNISKTSTYDYDDNRITFIKSLKLLTSNSGSTQEKTYQYVWDNTAGLNLQMLERNMLKEPLEEKFSTNQSSTTIENTFISPSYIGNGLILPGSKKIKINNVLTKSYYYNLYDRYGNPLEVKAMDESVRSYIYGYNGQYLIAEIFNASINQISDALGNDFQSIFDQLNSSDVTPLYVESVMHNLRVNLPFAEVTSFVYKPLVGIISKTDARGFAEYYEYDDSQRLIAVKDHDDNILNTFCYNFAGQQIDCSGTSLYYNNDELSREFIKNDCPSGKGGEKIRYTVPANKYSAATKQQANERALSDLNQNGQLFANQNGRCLDLFYNVEQSDQFIKDNCPVGYDGYLEIYHTIPAGLYSASSQAEADQKARDVLIDEGLVLARQQGQCRLISPLSESDLSYTTLSSDLDYGGEIHRNAVTNIRLQWQRDIPEGLSWNISVSLDGNTNASYNISFTNSNQTEFAIIPNGTIPSSITSAQILIEAGSEVSNESFFYSFPVTLKGQ